MYYRMSRASSVMMMVCYRTSWAGSRDDDGVLQDFSRASSSDDDGVLQDFPG